MTSALPPKDLFLIGVKAGVASSGRSPQEKEVTGRTMGIIAKTIFAWVTMGTSSLLLVWAANCSFINLANLSTTNVAEANEPADRETAGDDYYAQDKAFVANPFCKACHLDFDEDELALNHEIAGIGCERCHGESLRHRSDEGNVTPPELMYPKERINPTCMMCHPRHEIRHVEDHRPILEAGLSIFESQEPDDGSGHTAKYCTDCHAPDHRMKVRTVRWNKATGEIIQ
jgi:hypothetical protein